MTPQMIWMTNKEVIDLVGKAFSHGESSPTEVAEEIVQDIMAEQCCRSSTRVFRIYTLEELSRLPSGKRLIHPLLGDGEICLTSELTSVRFNVSGKVVPLNPANADVWSCPLSIN